MYWCPLNLPWIYSGPKKGVLLIAVASQTKMDFIRHYKNCPKFSAVNTALNNTLIPNGLPLLATKYLLAVNYIWQYSAECD